MPKKLSLKIKRKPLNVKSPFSVDLQTTSSQYPPSMGNRTVNIKQFMNDKICQNDIKQNDVMTPEQILFKSRNSTTMLDQEDIKNFDKTR